MDRQAWIAVTLCVIGLVVWQVYMTSYAPREAPALPTPSVPPDLAAFSPAPSPTTAASPALEADAATAAAAQPEAVTAFEEKTETLANADMELRLTNRGGGISEVRLLNHAGEHGKGVITLNSPEHLPIGAILDDPGKRALQEFTMARQADGSVQFERKTPQGLTIRKRFILPPDANKKDNFLAELQVDFQNEGAQPYANPGYFLALGSTVPLHVNDMTAYTRLVWLVNGDPKSIDVNWFPAQSYPLIGVEKRGPKDSYLESVNAADWAAMSNQFFTTILTPLNSKVTQVWARPFDVKHVDSEVPLLGMEGAIGLPALQLQPGQTTNLRFQIYAGPKIYNQLAKLEQEQAEIMNFGFFKIISQALLNFLNVLHGFVKNYGFAIILLTACVKAVLWPLQNKANKSMRRMAALAPKMQEIREKYKDDPTRMNQEVMKLYKEHGVNPVGGCLPMMIQIPIFFGLFSMLGQAAELRNASFLWVPDLSQPDTLFVIPGMGWIPILGQPALGLPINVLPILMGATNVWLMRMTPNTGDAMQRRIMMFMPLIFLVFCYNFAAALALYYTTQNLFTILQLWVNQRQPLPAIEKAAPPPTGKRARKGRP